MDASSLPSTLGLRCHAEETKYLSLKQRFQQVHHTTKVMSKEEAVVQVQDEDDEPDEWYISRIAKSRPKLY